MTLDRQLDRYERILRSLIEEDRCRRKQTHEQKKKLVLFIEAQRRNNQPTIENDELRKLAFLIDAQRRYEKRRAEIEGPETRVCGE